MPNPAPDVNDSTIGHDGANAADVYSDPHCRYLLDHLQKEPGAVAVSAAARHVVAKITETPSDCVSDGVLRRVETWFHRGLLPTLDDADIVDYDPDAGTVRVHDTRDTAEEIKRMSSP
jgi:hypothetical protein